MSDNFAIGRPSKTISSTAKDRQTAPAYVKIPPSKEDSFETNKSTVKKLFILALVLKGITTIGTVALGVLTHKKILKVQDLAKNAPLKAKALNILAKMGTGMNKKIATVMDFARKNISKLKKA